MDTVIIAFAFLEDFFAFDLLISTFVLLEVLAGEVVVFVDLGGVLFGLAEVFYFDYAGSAN